MCIKKTFLTVLSLGSDLKWRSGMLWLCGLGTLLSTTAPSAGCSFIDKVWSIMLVNTIKWDVGLQINTNTTRSRAWKFLKFVFRCSVLVPNRWMWSSEHIIVGWFRISLHPQLNFLLVEETLPLWQTPTTAGCWASDCHHILDTLKGNLLEAIVRIKIPFFSHLPYIFRKFVFTIEYQCCHCSDYKDKRWLSDQPGTTSWTCASSAKPTRPPPPARSALWLGECEFRTCWCCYLNVSFIED